MKSELRRWLQGEESRRRTERLQHAQERRAALAALGLSRFAGDRSETPAPVQAPAAAGPPQQPERIEPLAPEPARASLPPLPAADPQPGPEPRRSSAPALPAAAQPAPAGLTLAPVLLPAGPPRSTFAQGGARSVQMWRDAFPDGSAPLERPGAVSVGFRPAPAAASERSLAVTSPGSPPPPAPAAPAPLLAGEERVLPSRGSSIRPAPWPAMQPPSRSASAPPGTSAPPPPDRSALLPALGPDTDREDADDEDIELHFIAREPLRLGPG